MLDLFFCYSHCDDELRDQLENHLRMLQRQGLIRPWYDKRIGAGEDWKHTIDSKLESAHIVLFLVSSDFLASDYCYELEMKRALARHDEGSAKVVPIILRPCEWEQSPFGKLQSLPRDSKPITSWENLDEAFLDVSRGLRRLISESKRMRRSLPTDSQPEILRVGGAPTVFEGPGAQPACPVPHFVGRQAELELLTRTLHTSAEPRCLVVSGPGGMGKTTLVRHFVATAAASLFPDGSFWLDADRLQLDVARIVQILESRQGKRIGSSLISQYPIGSQEMVIDLVAALSRRASLVVIDNVEPNLELLETKLLPLVNRRQGRTVLTSRALNLHEDLGLPSLNLSLDRWHPETCRIFITSVVPTIREGSWRDEIDRLTAFVGHLPLAVRLIAKLLRRPATTPGRLLDQLADQPIETLDKAATGADRAVSSTFQHSLDQLDPEDLQVILAAAACARRTTGETIAAVADLNIDIVHDRLVSLAELSLIEHVSDYQNQSWEVSEKEGLWTLHDVIAHIVRSHEGIDAAYAAHNCFAAELLAKDGQAKMLGVRDCDEVLTAVERLIESDSNQGIDLLSQVRSRLPEGYLGIVSDLYRKLPEGSGTDQATCFWLGRARQKLERYAEATESFRKALGSEECLRDESLQLSVLLRLAECQQALGRTNDVNSSLHLAAALFSLPSEAAQRADAARALGRACCRLGQRELMERFHKQAAALHKSLDARRAEVEDQLSLADCLFHFGQLQEAITMYESSLEILRSSGRFETGIQLYPLNALALSYQAVDQHHLAIERWRMALELAVQLEAKEEQSRILRRLAWGLVAVGKWEAAVEHFADALVVDESAGWKAEQLLDLDGLRHCQRHLGATTEAIASECRLELLQERIAIEHCDQEIGASGGPLEILLPETVTSVLDLKNYYRQRLGPNFDDIPFLYVDKEDYLDLLQGAAPLLGEMLSEAEAAANEIFLGQTGDKNRVIMTFNIESATTGNRAVEFIRSRRSTETHERWLDAMEELSKKLQALHRRWRRQDVLYHFLHSPQI